MRLPQTESMEKRAVSISEVPSPVESVEEAPLSPRRAFVVQFRESADEAHELFAGRVEHVVSGRRRTLPFPGATDPVHAARTAGFQIRVREEPEERSPAGGGRRYRGASGSSRLPGLGKSESQNGSKGEKR